MTTALEETGVSGHHGVNGALAASHVTKGGNLGTEHVFLLLSAQMVKVRKRNLVILIYAQASITSMVVKLLVISLSKLMLSISLDVLWVCHAG